jgi:hypothetical protein
MPFLSFAAAPPAPSRNATDVPRGTAASRRLN